MEDKLKLLFEYQKFENNPKLKQMLYEAENTAETLSDDLLSLVVAAGIPEEKEKKKEDLLNNNNQNNH